MTKDELVKTIVDKTEIPSEKASSVLDQMFVNRAIPSVLENRIFSNIARGSDVPIEQARKAVGVVFGKLTEDPAIFELVSNQLVSPWINDCDGCNACGSSLVAQSRLQQVQRAFTTRK